MEMEDDIDQEITVTEEKVPEIVTKLARLTAEKAVSELEKTSKIEFDPQKDVDHMENVLKSALYRLSQIAMIECVAEPSSNPKIQIDNNMEQIQMEAQVSKSMKIYADIIANCVKEKRLLADQNYGASQNMHMTKATVTRSMRVSPSAAKSLPQLQQKMRPATIAVSTPAPQRIVEPVIVTDTEE